MAIIIDPNTLLLNVNGFPIRDFPATGTILDIARGQAPVTYVPSFGRAAGIIGPAWWNISVTVESGSESDNWFEGSLRAFLTLKKVWSSSASRGGQPMYSSVELFPTAAPNIVLAADGLPMRTWVMTGKCTVEPTAGTYVAASALSVEEVQSA